MAATPNGRVAAGALYRPMQFRLYPQNLPDRPAPFAGDSGREGRRLTRPARKPGPVLQTGAPAAGLRPSFLIGDSSIFLCRGRFFSQFSAVSLPICRFRQTGLPSTFFAFRRPAKPPNPAELLEKRDSEGRQNNLDRKYFYILPRAGAAASLPVTPTGRNSPAVIPTGRSEWRNPGSVPQREPGVLRRDSSAPPRHKAGAPVGMTG